MSLTSNYVTAIEHSQDTSTAIEIVNTQPSTAALLPTVNPGKIIGYYNSTTDSIQLYVADGNGLRYVPVKLYVAP